MALKVCAEPGCPELTKATRCTTHTRTRDAARGRRQARGYDADYDRERRTCADRMARGERFRCWRCHKLIDPAGAWDLGHCVHDKRVIHGPQHVGCNRDTASDVCSHISHVTLQGGG